MSNVGAAEHRHGARTSGCAGRANDRDPIVDSDTVAESIVVRRTCWLEAACKNPRGVTQFVGECCAGTARHSKAPWCADDEFVAIRGEIDRGTKCTLSGG